MIDIKEKLAGLIYQNSPRLVEEEAEILAKRLIANGVTVLEWIPVTERLPVDWCPVLVMVREIEKPLLGSYRENVWFHEMWNATFINGAVTHWMPLPKPPKGE